MIGMFFAVLFNFKTTGTIVFRSRNNRLIGRFFGVYIIIYLVNIVGIKAFLLFNINPDVSGAIMLIPTVLISFNLNKRYVFIS